MRGPILLTCLLFACTSSKATAPPPAAPTNETASASDPCKDLPAATKERAIVIHKQAEKEPNARGMENAVALYRAYLKHAANCPGVSQVRYYLAEALWRIASVNPTHRNAAAMWEEAAIAFGAALKARELDPKRTKDAAYAAILAWKNAIGVAKPGVANAQPPKRTSIPTPLPPRHRRMVEAFLEYERVVKDQADPELAMIKFLRARMYWRHNQLAKAVPVLEQIVRRYPERDVGEYASNLLLDSLNRMQKWAAFSAWVKEMRANPKLLEGRTDLRNRLVVLSRQIARKQAETYEAQGDYARCAAVYLDIYTKAPKADGADIALYNAGMCLKLAGEPAKAAATWQTLVNSFPKSRLAPKARQHIKAVTGATSP